MIDKNKIKKTLNKLIDDSKEICEIEAERPPRRVPSDGFFVKFKPGLLMTVTMVLRFEEKGEDIK